MKASIVRDALGGNGLRSERSNPRWTSSSASSVGAKFFKRRTTLRATSSGSLAARVFTHRSGGGLNASSEVLKDVDEFNGFHVAEAPPSLCVQASNVAPFSMPQEVLSYQPTEEATVMRFRGGDVERRLHCNTELTEDELSKLDIMREVARAQALVVTPALARDASRYLGRAKGDPKRAVREMASTMEWRRDYFSSGPVVDNEALLEDLSQGIVYFAGRDRLMRPALVLRPKRIPMSWYSDKKAAQTRLVRLLVFCIEYMMKYMLLPGQVEGGVALMDMGGLSLSQVPFGPLKSILTIMASHYVNRIFKFYMLNLPSALTATLHMGMRLLTDRQRQKVQLVRSLDELRSEFALHQLEVDFGGSRQLEERFFPFPLPPGPFEAGSTAGPATGAVPNLHAALSPEAVFGRVLDPKFRPAEEKCEVLDAPAPPNGGAPKLALGGGEEEVAVEATEESASTSAESSEEHRPNGGSGANAVAATDSSESSSSCAAPSLGAAERPDGGVHSSRGAVAVEEVAVDVCLDGSPSRAGQLGHCGFFGGFSWLPSCAGAAAGGVAVVDARREGEGGGESAVERL